MLKNIKSLLNSFLSEKSSWKIKIFNNWPSIAGKLHAHICIEKITNDTIILVVDNSCLLQELYHLSDLLRHKINQTLDQPQIKNVRFKLKNKKKIHTKKKALQKKIVIQNVTLKKSDIIVLKKIKDQGLKKALENFRLRCYQE